MIIPGSSRTLQSFEEMHLKRSTRRNTTFEMIGIINQLSNQPWGSPALQALCFSDFASFNLQTSKSNTLARSMVCWNLHVQSSTAIAKVFSGEDSTLLADEQGSLTLLLVYGEDEAGA
jgi:hypothetical protein